MISNLKIEKICNYLLYGFVFLIPWQSRYIYKFLTLKGKFFEYGQLSFYFNEVFLFLLIIFFLFYFKSQLNLKTKISFISKIIFLFLIVALISWAGALNFSLYFYGLIKLIEAIVLYILISKLNFSYLKLGWSFLFSMFIHSCLAIYQFFSQSITANKYLGIAEQISAQGGVSVLEGGFGRLLRAYGGLSHPNILGGFLVVAILILINIYLIQKNKNNILFFLFLIILFFALILSFSRSAGLALFVSLLFLLIYSVVKKIEIKKIFSIILVLIIFSGISFILLNDFIQTRIQRTERLEVKSSMERNVLQDQAQLLIKDNWFLGVGMNNYVLAVHEKINNNLNIWNYQPVHNVYLLVWAELGILGLALYLFLIIYLLYQCFKLNNDNVNRFILGLIMLSILIINFWDHYFYTYWSGLLFFFLIISLINKSLLFSKDENKKTGNIIL